MDADGHGIVVGMVGFSMALMGFVLSLVAPVVQSVYPRFHQQLPALILDRQARHHAQRHVVSPMSQDVGGIEEQTNNRTSSTPSGSADSVATADLSAASSVTNATSLLSDGKHAEERGRKEEVGTSSVDKEKGAKEAKRSVSATNSSPCTPRTCIARVAGLRSRSYSKPKRAGSTSTAASTSSADVAQQSLGRGRMTDSPTSSALNLPSRSSSEIDVNYVMAPLSPVRLQQKEGKEETTRKPSDRPRPLSRAKTFFNIGRSSSKRRQTGPTNPPPSGPLPPLPIHAATIDDSHSSMSPDHSDRSASQQIPFPSDHTTSETPVSNLVNDRVNEHGVIQAADEAQLGLERPKSITISCLGKLKGKKKTSTLSLSAQSHNTRPTEATEIVQDDVTHTRTARPSSPRSQSARPTSLHLPSPNTPPNISQPTPRLSKKHSKKSNSPPSRTRPYEAPYFFPMPTSPDAVDYVRRTRNEFARAQSGLSRERPNAIHAHNNEVKETTSKADKRKSEMSVPERDLKTAPAHRVGFHFPLHFHRSHKRATSLSSPISPPISPTEGQPEVDELGFVRPAQDLRVSKLKGETAPLTAKGIVRSATLSGNDLPTNGDPSRPLRPALSVKGASQ